MSATTDTLNLLQCEGMQTGRDAVLRRFECGYPFGPNPCYSPWSARTLRVPALVSEDGAFLTLPHDRKRF